MSKLLEHFKRMQEAATRYLTPDGYVDREGRIYYIDDQAARAFASDMIYMLDGPEQREAQVEVELSAEAFETMREFCARVDRGEVRSKRTYAKFARILERVPQR
jgi:hypothetical protein